MEEKDSSKSISDSLKWPFRTANAVRASGFESIDPGTLQALHSNLPNTRSAHRPGDAKTALIQWIVGLQVGAVG